jgi:indolepyruvate ferredoxin oxidoreductase
MEKRLLAQYEADIAMVRAGLDASNIEAGAALLSVPSLIRGFGHVKADNARKAEAERERLIARFGKKEADPTALQAAE